MMADGAIWASILQQLDLFDLVGLLGALLYMASYSRLVMRPATIDQAGYFAINLVAAVLLLVSLAQSFNLGAAVVQFFFVAMSLVGIFSRSHPLRRFRQRRLGSPLPRSIRWVNEGEARRRG